MSFVIDSDPVLYEYFLRQSFPAIVMTDVSFNSLLEQALTFGVKRITPSRLPQFIGFIVYAGLIAAVWTGFSLKLDQRIVVAGITLLLIAAIMTLLLLLGATIFPVVLNILVIIVVVGFLAIAGYAVVRIASPDAPIELHLQATLQYADHLSAGRFSVGIAGNQSAVETSGNGYFDLTITPEDVHEGKVSLHIESPEREYAEDQKISVSSKGTTRTTVLLRTTSASLPSAQIQTTMLSQSGSHGGSPQPQKEDPKVLEADALAGYNRAKAFWDQDPNITYPNLDRLLPEIKRTLTLRPDFPEAKSLLSTVVARLNTYCFSPENSEETLDGQAKMLYNCGAYFLRLNDPTDAVNEFTLALEKCPNEDHFLTNLIYEQRATAYYRIGRFQSARDDSTSVIRYATNDTGFATANDSSRDGYKPSPCIYLLRGYVRKFLDDTSGASEDESRAKLLGCQEKPKDREW